MKLTLGELAEKHRQAASDLWLIREQYLSLIADLRGGTDELTSVRKQRDELLVDLHSAYTGAPSTNFKGYKQAQESLQAHEDMTFSDAEIDAFLPDELKRG